MIESYVLKLFIYELILFRVLLLSINEHKTQVLNVNCKVLFSKSSYLDE